MNNIPFILSMVTLFSCTDNIPSQKAEEREYVSLCGCKFIFAEKRVLSIVIHSDSSENRTLKDMFACFETTIMNDKRLRERFVNNSETILFTLFSDSVNYFNQELVKAADSSMYWTGSSKPAINDVDSGMHDSHTQFVNMINNSSYRLNWEKSLNRIYGKNIKWEYSVERVQTLKFRDNRILTKQRYPIGFELVLKRCNG